MCPVYIYKCKCTEVEEVRKVADRDEGVGDICPLCEEEVERLMTASTFILKGSCWERDNYSTTLGDAVKHGKTFKSE